MIPFLVFSLAAIGLNLLTGYTGLLSLGTGAFMGVGAYACYKLTTLFPGVNIIVWILVLRLLLGRGRRRCSGCRRCASRASISRSRRSPRSSSCQWCFVRVPWLYNYNVSGAIEVPTRTLFGVPITGAERDAGDALSRRAGDRRR